MTREGFVEQRPADAFDIVSQGDRHHHDEQVLDGYRTEAYTEMVPYQEMETYTDQERCGEDCTSLPEHCSESCTSDNNGFATCTTHCSGGGQSCAPRYCPVTRTRSVTRHRPEQRTREVPIYRSEPRYAEYFEWHVWAWEHDRDVVAQGTALDPLAWPGEAELAPPTALAEGERERQRRDERYSVTVMSSDGGPHVIPVRDLAELRRIAEVPRWFGRVDGRCPMLRCPSCDAST